MAEYDIDTAHSQEGRWLSSRLRSLLILVNQCLILQDLCGSGDERDQLGELLTELLNAKLIDDEEKVSLCLLGKTGPMRD